MARNSMKRKKNFNINFKPTGNFIKNHLNLTPLLFALLAFVLLLPISSSAQDGDPPSFTPLVNQETSLILKINVNQFDLDSLVQGGMKAANNFIDSAITDKESANQVKVALPLMAAGYLGGLTSLFDSLKEAEISEFYFISTPNCVEESPGYFAVPVGSKTKEDLADVQKSMMGLKGFNIPLRNSFIRHGFLFSPVIAAPLSDDQFKSFIRREFKTLRPADRPEFSLAFAEFPNAGLAYVFIGNDKTMKQFTDSMAEINAGTKEAENAGAIALSETLLSELPEFARLISYTVAALDQSESAFRIKVKLDSVNSAEKANEIIGRIQTGIENAVNSSEEPFHEEIKELVKEITDVFLPKIENDALEWRFDENFLSDHRPLMERYFELLEKEKSADGETDSPLDPPLPAVKDKKL